jgi:pyruvate,orthophosphate dikinase
MSAYIYILGDERITVATCGAKAARLSDMMRLGLPIPAGFVIPIQEGGVMSPELRLFVKIVLGSLAPYGISVRSSGRVSMPGMLNTVLDIVDVEVALEAIDQVFASWNSPRAKAYRVAYGLSDDCATGIVVQRMIYGDADENSGTGIVFTRNPMTNEDRLSGEYLSICRGDALASGQVIPDDFETAPLLAYQQLYMIGTLLEQHYGVPQELEFTIQSEVLYILQARDMRAADKGRLMIDPSAPLDLLALGTPASHGVGTGVLVFDLEAASRQLGQGRRIVFATEEANPDDFELMTLSEGFFTMVGGVTSHSAVVARALKKPCVVGCGGLTLDLEKKELRTLLGAIYREGDLLTVDGTSGLVVKGTPPLVKLINNS